MTQSAQSPPPVAPPTEGGGSLTPRTVLGVLGLAVLVAFIVLLAVRLGAGDARGGFGIIALGRAVDLKPRPAPDFELTAYDGTRVRLSDHRGKVVVLNFWASWCPPCRLEAPVLEAAWQEYRDRGVLLVGVGVWDDDDDARAFLAETGVTYPNAPDTSRGIPVEYGVTGLPETFVIDAKGVLVRRWIGPLDAQQFRDLIAPVLPA
ncbi:MAG: redoxin domain-containing protein [Actinobacteria bacterium]|nr:redoxin domain-containing protein [Actinomycetota bacterium]